MAAHHVDRIRSVQPHGPYLVGGMCAGGVLAFEIARQLQAEGEPVAMVALLDAADVAAPPRAWRIARGRARSFATAFRPDPSGRPGRRALSILARAARKARNLAVYEAGKHLAALREGRRFRRLRHYLDRGMRLPRSLEGIPVRTVYQLAEKDYHPAGQFDGELVLFRATTGSGTAADEPFVARYEDPLLGWGRRATRGVRVLDVPGGHSSMLQEPHVRVLAEQMQAYLGAALAAGPSPRPAELAPALAGD
jgi:thioesterase domain-containing protein